MYGWKLLAKTVAEEKFLEQALRPIRQKTTWESNIPCYGAIRTLNPQKIEQKMAGLPVRLES